MVARCRPLGLGQALLLGSLTIAFATVATQASAQNDWQFPDPYFGALQFEKSHPPRPPRVAATPDATSPRDHQVAPRRSQAVRHRGYRTRPRWGAKPPQ